MKFNLKAFAILCMVSIMTMNIQAANKKGDYVVLTSQAIKNSSDWMQVVNELQKKHKADVIFYVQSPTETLDDLKKIAPRYVAIVEQPENIDVDFVYNFHLTSRKIDEDIYGDFIWGMITGYSAEEAMKMVQMSSKPFVVNSCLGTTNALKAHMWFKSLVYYDTTKKGLYGSNLSGDLNESYVEPYMVLSKYVDSYNQLNPDLIVSSAHATEEELEMPHSLGSIKCKNGELYADLLQPKKLNYTNKPRVYYAAGNCLIGNVNATKNSMAIAWMKSGGATSMVGYTVPTWFGKNGWGGLKYWLANPGKLTLAEAVYLNQQEMLHTINSWDERILSINYLFVEELLDRYNYKKRFEKIMGRKPTKEEIGYMYDLNVVAFYGDPAWDVRPNTGSNEMYEVDFVKKRNQCVVTIKTNSNYDANKVKGYKLKQEHTADVPFSYFFPKRLNNPKLAEGQNYKVTLAEDFIILYDTNFKKDEKYQVIININK